MYSIHISVFTVSEGFLTIKYCITWSVHKPQYLTEGKPAECGSAKILHLVIG